MQTQQKFEPATVRRALELLKDEDGIRWSEVAERVSAERGEDKRTMYQRLYRLLNGKRPIPLREVKPIIDRCPTLLQHLNAAAEQGGPETREDAAEVRFSAQMREVERKLDTLLSSNSSKDQIIEQLMQQQKMLLEQLLGK